MLRLILCSGFFFLSIMKAAVLLNIFCENNTFFSIFQKVQKDSIYLKWKIFYGNDLF